MDIKRGAKNLFDSEHTFDFDSGHVAVEYGVSIGDSHEEIGHWSDLVPQILIPGF